MNYSEREKPTRMEHSFKYLGQASREPSREMDTFLAPFGVVVVEFTSHELTSNCPVTGQPDFSTVVIRYQPGEKCIESKSLKLYLWSFRETRIFGEALASVIAQDIWTTAAPRWIEVEIRQSVRGGLQMTARARLESE